MRKHSSLINKLQADYPQFSFQRHGTFFFRPKNNIFYNPKHSDLAILILHELSHAILGHYDYCLDIELIQIENAAWTQTEKFCKKYQVFWDKDIAEANLDTYREWLHRRSRCPRCKLTGYQKNQTEYHCLACSKNWTSLAHKH